MYYAIRVQPKMHNPADPMPRWYLPLNAAGTGIDLFDGSLEQEDLDQLYSPDDFSAAMWPDVSQGEPANGPEQAASWQGSLQAVLNSVADQLTEHREDMLGDSPQAVVALYDGYTQATRDMAAGILVPHTEPPQPLPPPAPSQQ